MKGAEDFGARLKALRLEAGLSVAALALAAGTTRQHVYRLESGESAEPTLSLLRGLAAALGCGVGELCG